MTFEQAKKFVMPLGKHKGDTLHDIGGDDDGLLYLDWLTAQKWLAGTTREAIETYVLEPVIANEIERLLEDE